MGITVSTSAFDATLKKRPGLCVWLSRGYVSADVCGFDLFLDANSEEPGLVKRFMSEIIWWGDDDPGSQSSLRLDLRDGKDQVPLTMPAGDSSGGEGEGKVRARLSVEFPTPPEVSQLVLTSSSPAWDHHAVVRFDSEELSRSLRRWKNR